MPFPTLPRVARTRGGHVWGEVWRVLAALTAGLSIWTVSASGAERGPAATGPSGPVGPSGSPFGEVWMWWDLGIGLACCGLLLWRRRWPLPVAVVTTALSAVSLVAAGASSIALISLATTRRWRAIVAVVVVWLAAGWVSFRWYRGWERGPLWTEIALAVLAVGFCVAVGFYIGERRAFVASLHERALTAEREQSMRVAQARVGERARIAREMHDVLAHRISLVAMHSGALAYRTDLSREEIVETAEVVRSSANLALTELRAVLGVLRDVDGVTAVRGGGGGVGAERGSDAATSPVSPASPGVPEPPQPTLADLDGLVAESGGDVALQVVGRPDAVPATVSRNAFRIIQESLTNARKHAPHAPVALRLEVVARDGDRGELVLTVRNAVLPTTGPRVEGAGVGLIGLTERAVLSGGELTYGPDRRGDFVVTARLPWGR